MTRDIGLLLFFFLFIIPIGPIPHTQALGDDLEDIQASFQAEVNAFNAHQEEAFITPSHQDVVVFGTLYPGIIRGKEAFQQLLRDYFTTHANAFFSPIYADFRVAGTTALAWGHYTLSDISIEDLADAGPQKISHGRYTFSYTKTDQGWQLVALYFSPLQTFAAGDANKEK